MNKKSRKTSESSINDIVQIDAEILNFEEGKEKDDRRKTKSRRRETVSRNEGATEKTEY